MPAGHHESSLEAALSFYSHIVTVNAEGDSLVSEETLEGLGTTGFLLQALFGSLLKLANPKSNFYTQSSPTSPSVSRSAETTQQVDCEPEMTTNKVAAAARAATVEKVLADKAVSKAGRLQTEGAAQRDIMEETPDTSEVQEVAQKSKLTELLPEPGYFLAGAVSGGVSRTATAPLDRLKVYLLVNTQASTPVALDAAKHGHPIAAIRSAGGPIADAMVKLWRAGGMRSLFAGKTLFLNYPVESLETNLLCRQRPQCRQDHA